jgi:hypothetical protein
VTLTFLEPHFSWSSEERIYNLIFFNFVEITWLKGQYYEISDTLFFHQTIPPGRLLHGIKRCHIWIRIREENPLSAVPRSQFLLLDNP